jgi:hypothetical protein
MSSKQELIKDIEMLPENILQAISVIVKGYNSLDSKSTSRPSPVFGSGKGLMWIADDFDEPLEELREYME